MIKRRTTGLHKNHKYTILVGNKLFQMIVLFLYLFVPPKQMFYHNITYL